MARRWFTTRRLELNDGDRLTIGVFEFDLRVSAEAAPMGSTRVPMSPEDPFAAFAPSLAQKAGQEDDTHQSDPFNFGQPVAAPVSAPARPAGPAAKPGDLLARTDPLDASNAGVQILRGKPGSSPPAAFDFPDLSQRSAPGAIDRLLQPGLPAPRAVNVAPPHTLAAHPEHVDPVDLPFSSIAGSPPGAGRAQAAAAPNMVGVGSAGGVDLDDIFAGLPGAAPRQASMPAVATAPRMVAPTAPTPVMPALVTPTPITSAPSTPATAATPDGQALLAALLDGLGLPGLAVENPHAFLQQVGAMLRVSVGGFHALLQLRADTKRELGAEDRTMLAARNNNPLKHADSVEEALKILLPAGPHNPAFLAPVTALEDASRDIRAHELAVMAGMRAGVEGTIRKFQPKVLESRIKKAGTLDAVMPALYKSKLWEAYVDMYDELGKDAEEHFETLFGKEFVKAYMEQARLLKKR